VLYRHTEGARASEIQFVGHDVVKDRTIPTSQFFGEKEGTDWKKSIFFRRVTNSR